MVAPQDALKAGDRVEALVDEVTQRPGDPGRLVAEASYELGVPSGRDERGCCTGELLAKGHLSGGGHAGGGQWCRLATPDARHAVDQRPSQWLDGCQPLPEPLDDAQARDLAATAPQPVGEIQPPPDQARRICVLGKGHRQPPAGVKQPGGGEQDSGGIVGDLERDGRASREASQHRWEVGRLVARRVEWRVWPLAASHHPRRFPHTTLNARASP